MNAIILAGGKGSRLMPLTEQTPKPMLEVAGRPILDYVVSQLAYYGVNDVIFSLGYKWNAIAEHVRGYRQITPRICVEQRPLGTCGGVKYAEDKLNDRFIVLSGDCLSNVDLDAMLNQHLISGAEVTIAVTETQMPSLYGVVSVDTDNRVISFHEKPSDDRYGNLINCGIYVINKSVLDLVPTNRSYDFSLDLFPVLLERGSLYTYRHCGYWSDVGDIASYYEANRFFMNGGFYPEIVATRQGLMKRVGSSVVADSAIVKGSAYRSVIGEGGFVMRGVTLTDCVVLRQSTVDKDYERCIIQGDKAVFV